MLTTEALLSPGGRAAPGSDKFCQLRAACAVLIERSLKTLRAVDDPHARFLRGPQCSLPEPVRDIRDCWNEADGYTAGRRPKFRPTPRDVSRYLEVLTTLLPYLESLPDGRRLLRVTLARANGVPYWKIAQRLGGGSDSNVRRLWSVAIDACTRRFWKEIEAWSDGTV